MWINDVSHMFVCNFSMGGIWKLHSLSDPQACYVMISTVGSRHTYHSLRSLIILVWSVSYFMALHGWIMGDNHICSMTIVNDNNWCVSKVDYHMLGQRIHHQFFRFPNLLLGHPAFRTVRMPFREVSMRSVRPVALVHAFARPNRVGDFGAAN